MRHVQHEKLLLLLAETHAALTAPNAAKPTIVGYVSWDGYLGKLAR